MAITCFEDLEIWQDSRELCKVIRVYTSREPINYPDASGRGMKDPTHKAKKVSPQAVGNITHLIPRLCSGSVRLNNFDSQNYSLTDLTGIIDSAIRSIVHPDP